MSGLLNKQQACRNLGVDEEELDRFVQEGRLTAYKLGGMYVRFKQEELEALRRRPSRIAGSPQKSKSGVFESILDFLYYNDFYIFGLIIILLLLAILFKISL